MAYRKIPPAKSQDLVAAAYVGPSIILLLNLLFERRPAHGTQNTRDDKENDVDDHSRSVLKWRNRYLTTQPEDQVGKKKEENHQRDGECNNAKAFLHGCPSVKRSSFNA